MLLFYFILLLVNLLGYTRPNHLGWAKIGPARLNRVGPTISPTALSSFLMLGRAWSPSLIQSAWADRRPNLPLFYVGLDST